MYDRDGRPILIGAIAFSFAYFEKRYWPLQVVAVFFFIEFLVRVSAGISRSPIGLLTGWMTQRQQPDWVSAKPKRFVWTLGLAMLVFDGFHHELRHTRMAAEVYLPGLSRSHVARIGARALLGLRESMGSWCGIAGRPRTRPSRFVPTVRATSPFGAARSNPQILNPVEQVPDGDDRTRRWRNYQTGPASAAAW